MLGKQNKTERKLTKILTVVVSGVKYFFNYSFTLYSRVLNFPQ